MVEVDAGIFYNKSAKSKDRKVARKGQSYEQDTLSLCFFLVLCVCEKTDSNSIDKYNRVAFFRF